MADRNEQPLIHHHPAELVLSHPYEYRPVTPLQPTLQPSTFKPVIKKE